MLLLFSLRNPFKTCNFVFIFFKGFWVNKLLNFSCSTYSDFDGINKSEYLFQVHISFKCTDAVLKMDFDIFIVIFKIGCFSNRNMAAILETQILNINVLIPKLFMEQCWCNMLCRLIIIDRWQKLCIQNCMFYIIDVCIAKLGRKKRMCNVLKWSTGQKKSDRNSPI